MAPEVERRHVIVVRELPATRETSLLRLLGRGPTFRGAVAELESLPRVSYEKRLALPLLVAFRMEISQNSSEEDMQDYFYNTSKLYKEWEQRVRREGMDAGRREGMDAGRREGMDAGRREGMDAGRKHGLLDGERAMVRRLLTRRFGPLPDDVETRIDQAGRAELERWADRLLTAATLDEVLAA